MVPGLGLFKAGTTFSTDGDRCRVIREDNKNVYVWFEGEEKYQNAIMHRFSKTHIIELKEEWGDI
jgi:hypothetical protein